MLTNAADDIGLEDIGRSQVHPTVIHDRKATKKVFFTYVFLLSEGPQIVKQLLGMLHLPGVWALVIRDFKLEITGEYLV